MASSNHTIPNDAEPTKPFIVVQFHNAIKLSSTNYITWQTQIQSILIGYGLFSFLDGSRPAPPKTIPNLVIPDAPTPNPAYTTWLRQDKLLFGALVGTLSPSVAPLITRATTSKDAWDILANTYAKPSRGHIHQLKDKLRTMKKGSQSISEFMQQVKHCTDLRASLGKELDQEDIVEYVLHGLDDSFQSVIDGVYARDTPIPFDELHEKLIQKELQLKTEGVESTSSPATALTMQSKFRSKAKPHIPTPTWSSQPARPYTPRPHQTPSHTSNFPNPSYHPRPFLGKCQWCGTQGHVMATCQGFRQAAPHLRPPSLTRYQNPPYSSPSPPTTYAPRPPPQANVATNSTHPWLLDSGSSHHVTQDLQNLSTHYPYEGPDTLHIGDGKGLPISSIGGFTFNTHKHSFSFDNVLHVPQISQNIISVSQFTSQNNLSVEFLPSCFLVKDLTTGTILLSGPCVDVSILGLFPSHLKLSWLNLPLQVLPGTISWVIPRTLS